jgi:hypothetical protein
MKSSLPYFRKSIKPESRTSSPKGIKSPRYGTSEFFASLEGQVKRIEPEFFFIWGEESPLTQAFNCVKQAIDQILNKSTSTELQSITRQKDSVSSKAISQEELNILNNLKEKEEEISAKLENCSKKEEKVLKDKEKLRKMKKTLFELEDELRNVKEELNNEFIQLNQQKSKFRVEKEAAEKERIEMKNEKKKILEEKLMIDRKELEFKSAYDELEMQKEMILQEKTEIDRDRWILEQEKDQVEEQVLAINNTREVLQVEFERLEHERSEFMKKRQELSKSASKVKNDSRPCFDFYDDSKSPSFAPQELSEQISNPSLENILTLVQNDLYSVEDELLKKSHELDEKESKLTIKEKLINEKMHELQIIQETLSKSSNDLNELLQQSLPKLSNDSKIVEKLLNQLCDLQKQLLTKAQASASDSVLIESIKSLTSNQQVSKLVKVLQEKIEKVNYKEKVVLESVLDFEIREKELEIAEERIRNEQSKFREEHEARICEIELAKTDILKLQQKLEKYLEEINEKERKIDETYLVIRSKIN